MRLSPNELRSRAAALRQRLASCDLCPHACGVDRARGEPGRCGAGASARVASFGPHFGEESVLVGRGGSGTVFFSGCNLGCVFCQNWEISQRREGTDLTDAELAAIFFGIARSGCANLNLVTPTHQASAIVAALALAVDGGFDLPIVWNCGGYEAADVLRLLDGIVDVYMPDLKFADDAIAERLCGAADYVDAARSAVREMHRQVGDLTIDEDGIARRGLLVRHLVLPEGLAGTQDVARFLADEVSRDTFVNVMDQYRPCHRALEHHAIARPTTRSEHASAKRMARDLGLHRFAE